MVHRLHTIGCRSSLPLATSLGVLLLLSAAVAEQPAPSILPSDRLETSLVEIRDLALTADGKLLAVAGKSDYGSGGVIQFWDLAQAKKLHEEQASPNLVAVSPDGRRVVYQGKTGGLRWLDAARESKAHQRLDFDRLIDVRFLRDGGVVIAGFNATGGPIKEEPGEPDEQKSGEETTTSEEEIPLVGSNGEQVVGWDLGADQPRFAHAAGSLPIRALDVFADGTRVAIGTSDGGLCIWDVRTGQCAVNLVEQADYDVVGVAVSPDGELVASKMYATEVDVWDAASGEKVTTLSGSGNLCPDVVILADGATVAAASAHARGITASLWDSASGQEKAVLRQAPLGEPGSRRLGRLAVSANGQVLAASVGEGTVVLWEIGSFLGDPVKIPQAARVTLKPEVPASPKTGEPKDAAAQLRTWASADGRFTVKATFQGTKGELVFLRRDDGQALQIRIDQLSEADRQFVRNATAE